MSEPKSPSGLRIVFMGTPEFAVPSLKALVKAGENVVAVITAPDKPSGRGQKLMPTPVKEYALTQNLNILQPEKLKDPQFLEELAGLKADFQVVVAFRMLPEVVWNMPPLGTINLHASLLPDYRGAAPINWAIINGEKESGVSTFFLKHEIDTGDILLKASCPISKSTTAGELHDELMEIGAQLIIDSLKKIEAGDTNGMPQDGGSLKIAPKIFKNHCLIHWDQTGENILNLIRGMSPYPSAYTIIEGKQVKVFEAYFEPNPTILLETGKLFTDHKTFLKVKCQDGFISLADVQMESKKRMNIADFLRGFKLPE
jgi:methionyl-tRNA formyltransferase